MMEKVLITVCVQNKKMCFIVFKNKGIASAITYCINTLMTKAYSPTMTFDVTIEPYKRKE